MRTLKLLEPNPITAYAENLRRMEEEAHRDCEAAKAMFAMFNRMFARTFLGEKEADRGD